jgi:hypothetical protein
MGNYSATFNSGAGTGTDISDDKTIITCTKVSGKKALNLNGQQLTAENSTIEVVDLNLSGGASVSADKKIVATNLSSGGTDPVSVETKAAMQFTNISGSAPIKLHYYYTAKALTQTNNASKTATTQLTISGDINMIDSAKVTLIPSIYNAETKEYAQVSSDGILTLTVGNTVYVCQKLAAMPKAAAEDIVFSYDNGIIRGASDVVGARLYKYNGGLYITDQEMAVELVGISDGTEVYRAEYMSFADAVKEINTRNNKAMDYEIRLLKNIGFNGSDLAPTGGLSLPSNAKSLTILPAEGDKTGNTIAFTGGVTLGCNTTIENVCLVGAQKPRNKTYYEQTSYAVNVGGYTLTEIGRTWGKYVEGTAYRKAVSTLSGTAKGSYIIYLPVKDVAEGISNIKLAGQIKNVGTVEIKRYIDEDRAEDEAYEHAYVESGAIAGVIELILDKYTWLYVEPAAVTANNLTMDVGSGLWVKDITISKNTTLNQGEICAGTSTIGDGKVTLNNIILKSDGNIVRGKQDKNGKSLVTINGTVTADTSFTGSREGAIKVILRYNNNDDYAQLHTGMVVLTAQKVSPYWFTPAYNYNSVTAEDADETGTVYKMGEQTAGYGLLKSGKEIIYGQTDVGSAEAELVINAGTASEQHTLFKTFEEAVKEIDSLALYKDGTKTYADYKIILHKDVEVGNEKQNGRYNALALPSKVGTLTIEGGNHEIRFSGNLTLKSNLILSNTTITPVKTSGTVGVATKANWVLGNFNLTLNNVVTANASGSLVGNISGNASRTELVLTGTSITADQVSGIKTCTLDPGTSLETVKTMTVTNLVLNTDGSVDNGSTTVRCGGKMTVTLITKNGTDEAVIVKPSAGTLAIAGVTFADGLSDSAKKLTIEMEGGNYPTGTVILSGKAANASYYIVYTSQDDSSNVYRTYVSGTNLLLGQIDM